MKRVTAAEYERLRQEVEHTRRGLAIAEIHLKFEELQVREWRRAHAEARLSFINAEVITETE